MRSIYSGDKLKLDFFFKPAMFSNMFVKEDVG